jgi:lysylphosphatidylglycerol synthetase-like protein (DUF2156 family)
MTRGVRVALVTILVLLAILAFVVGFAYLHIEARHLPKILGRIHTHARFHRTHRGFAAIVAGAVLLVLAAVAAFVGRTPPARALPRHDAPPPTA